MTANVLNEACFQAAVVQLAHLCGWRVNHVRRTRGRGDRWTTSTSVAGWPDLTLWHPGRGLFLVRELKTDRGRLTAEQRQVLNELRYCGVDVDVWRPSLWPEIEQTLTGRTRAV